MPFLNDSQPASPIPTSPALLPLNIDTREKPSAAFLKLVRSDTQHETELVFPVTPAQQHIIDSSQTPRTTMIIDLPQHVDYSLTRLNATWHALTTAHPLLRAHIWKSPDGGKAFHRILRKAHPILDSSDLTGTSFDALPETTFMIHIDKSSIDSQDSFVVLNLPRILFDATSLGMLKLDFLLLYCGFPALQHTPFHRYVEFLDKKNLGDSHEFWRTRFDGIDSSRFLFLDHVGTADISTRQQVVIESNPAMLARLRDFEEANNCTRRSLFEAAWAVVVSRLADTAHAVFSGAGRDYDFAGCGSCVGRLDTIYPMRINVDESKSLQSLLKDIQDYHSEASRHATIGYNKSMEISGLTEMQSFVKYTDSLDHPYLDGPITDFPLMLLINGSDVIRFSMIFNGTVQVEQAEVLMHHFLNVFNNIIEMSDSMTRPLQDFSMDVAEDIRAHLEINAAAKEERSGNVADLLQEQVSSHPNSPAVQNEGEEPLSFKQFDQITNTIVARANIKPKTIVPICMQPSVSLIASVWAVIKAGAAYVVLDPAGSKVRNISIVEETEAEMVLTDAVTATLVPRSKIVDDLLSDARREGNIPVESPKIKISPSDPAYLVYTSGSTGKPKGVVLTHNAALNGIVNFSVGNKSRYLLFYNPIFSAAQRTMLAVLSHGACLCLASRDRLMVSLGDVLREMQIDSVGLTPSSLALLQPNDAPELKQITMTGELMTEEIIKKWAPHVDLRNSYGLSECTQLNFGRTLSVNQNARLVGRPTDTTKVYILAPGKQELVALGVPGELCLSGPQLGAGYLKQPEQTAKAFIDNPFGPGRLYRTGDLAMQHADRSIEILGRIDFQLKLNGQRIEPKEVAAVIEAHPGVAASVAYAVEVDGTKALAAAIVLHPENDWFEILPDIRSLVTSRLPSYMVPSFWMPYDDHIPVNANGKTDFKLMKAKAKELGRDGLLTLCQKTAMVDEASLTPAEKAVRIVWADVLDLSISRIGRDTSFVDLGGNSLQAIKAVMGLRARGQEVELRQIMQASSLSEVASSLKVAPLAGLSEARFSLLNGTTKKALADDSGVEDAFPATSLQEGLLAASLNGDTSYLYQRVYKVDNLDLAKLQKAFETVYKVRPMLRTTFVSSANGFLQVIRTDQKLLWKETDMDLDTFKEKDLEAGIQLGQPVIRVAVVQRDLLVVSAHHALFDFWSHRFLYQDVTSAYRGESLPERASFQRFVSWLSQRSLDADASFWKRYLSGAEHTIMSFDPQPENAVIVKKVPISITQIAQKLGRTSGAMIYACWAVILAKHTGNEDVAFATTLSGREIPVEGISELDGPTLTSVPQRVLVSPNATLEDLLESVANGLWDIVSHSQYGMRRSLATRGSSDRLLDTLVNVLVKDDDQSSSSIFQRHGPKPVWRSEYTTLEVQEEEDSLSVRLSTTMEHKRAAFVVDQFASLLGCFASHPSTKVADLTIMSQPEQDHLVMQADCIYPEPMLLHERFERLALTQPELNALEWSSGTRMSYYSLDKRANQLANHLIGLGVTRGDLIPLYLEKSFDMIVAILGVVKSGAAYVPLSPSNPVERNTYIAREIGARLVITEKEHGSFADSLELPKLEMDLVDLSQSSEDKPDVTSSPLDIAYTIYTSGSTGMPKGVAVSHGASAAAVGSMIVVEGRLNNKDQWRVLQFANYVFDASVQDIFNTLSSGGVLCLAPQDEILSDLTGVMKRMTIRQAILTPTVAKMFGPEEVPTLETLILGGEPMSIDVVKTWAPGVKLLNVYGPTETSMVVTTKHVLPDTSPKNIGAPFKTVSAQILERGSLRRVPYGAVGELCISGPQLAKGYLNRDDLTSKSFLAEGEGRVYRSGDLARWLPNGEIECLGRTDNQVKVAGHRIELGEIEGVIQATGLVHDNVAIVVHAQGKPQLASFCNFTVSDDQVLAADDAFVDAVRNLKPAFSQLAHYMVPKFLVPIGSFPLLPSRKVDRKQLRSMAEQMDPGQLLTYSLDRVLAEPVEIEPVSTDEEAFLEKMWSEIFGIGSEFIGANASFFGLGGDSISAINLVSACRKESRLMTVSDVLKSQTLREMATYLHVQSAEAQAMANAPFTPASSFTDALNAAGVSEDDIELTYPCPPGQVEFLEQGQREDQYWCLMNVRKLASTVDVDEWIKTTEELTRTDNILRSSFVKLPDVGWVAAVLKSSKIEFIERTCNAETRDKIIESELWEPRFAFGKPFIKYLLLDHENGTREIAIKMDHAVYDGTLLRIFDDHFAASQKKEPTPEHVQFSDFALYHWRAEKSASKEFWRNCLRGYDFQYPPSKSPSESPMITEFLAHPVEASPDLDRLATAAGVTVPVVFQAAFQIWLARAANSRDIGFDYLLTGRNVAMESPQLINGNCAQFLPFRSELEPRDANESLAAYLGRTQAAFWQATEHASLPVTDMHAAASSDDGSTLPTYRRNLSLFLFQPFEPAPPPSAQSAAALPLMKWVVMKGAQIRMYQPYTLVCEVSKTADGGHSVKIMYDARALTKDQAATAAKDVGALVRSMAEDIKADGRVEELL